MCFCCRAMQSWMCGAKLSRPFTSCPDLRWKPHPMLSWVHWLVGSYLASWTGQQSLLTLYSSTCIIAIGNSCLSNERHFRPTCALEATPNAVIGALVGGLLPCFMDRSAITFDFTLSDTHTALPWAKAAAAFSSFSRPNWQKALS